MLACEKIHPRFKIKVILTIFYNACMKGSNESVCVDLLKGQWEGI